MAASTFVIILIFVLDLIAFGLGIGAEQRRATGTVQHDDGSTYQWCYYSSDIASGLAAGALLFLVASQVILAAATRCLCCGPSLKPGVARTFSIIFCILTWISFIIAVSCYMAGAVQNAKHIRYFSSFATIDLNCEAIRKDTFAAGVAFTFFTFLLSFAHYLCWSKAHDGNSSWANKDAGVRMAAYP